MKGKWHVLAGALFLVALLFNLFTWGGLARSPVMGPVVTDAAARELALAGIYVPLGRAAVDAAGLSDSASDFAATQFAALQSDLLRNPNAAMETLVREMPTSVQLPYYGAPLLLLGFALAWWRRPRVPQTFRRR